MNLNWDRKDPHVPRLVITGATNEQHGKVKAFFPPDGVNVLGECIMGEDGVARLLLTWDRVPGEELKGVVPPSALDADELETLAAQRGIEVGGDINAADILMELAAQDEEDTD